MLKLVNPTTNEAFSDDGDGFVDAKGYRFPVVRGVPRFSPESNYINNFGMQWNAFRTTQIDRPDAGVAQSERRLFTATGWLPEALAGLDILEVGSGAGRFSRSILERTKANLWSVDCSSGVEANLASNGAIAPGRSTSARQASTRCPSRTTVLTRSSAWACFNIRPTSRPRCARWSERRSPAGMIGRAIDREAPRRGSN